VDRRTFPATALVVLAAIATPSMAAAQDIPAATVSGSYAVLKDKDVEGLFGLGWVASVGIAATRSVEIVGEAGGHYKTVGAPGGSGTEATVKIHTFLGGARYRWRGKGGSNGFVQVLAGAANGSAGITACGAIPVEFCRVVQGIDVSRTFFALQPGGGVDVAIARRTAVRLQADYRAIFPSEEEGPTVAHEVRFAAGVVVGFGRR
jgi:hypothetical protein